MATLKAYKEKLNMEQNNNPMHFALNADESDLVRRIDDIVQAANVEYVTVDENGKSQLVLPSDYYAKIKLKIQSKQYNRKRINLSRAEGIAKRIFSKPWYTIMIAGESEKTNKLMYCMVTSETKGKSILIKENSPYYALPHTSGYLISNVTDDNYLEERKALGLTPEHKFLYSTEYIALQTISRLKNASVEYNTVSSREWVIKSSPMLILPISAGREALINAKNGAREERGKIIIPVGEQSVSFLPSKASEEWLKGNIAIQKFLDTIQIWAAKTGYSTTQLAIPLKEIAQDRGLSDVKELKKQLTTTAALVDAMTFTGKLNDGDFEKLAITQNDTSIKNGYLYIRINERFFKALKETKYILLYAKQIMKLPTKGYSYGFARTFSENKRKNLGKPNENRISVETLLKSAPYPLYDELKDKGQASQKIIEPFIKCFEQIEEYGAFCYNFVHRRGEPLTDSEWESLSHDYNLFKSLMVEISWYDEPDYKVVMESRRKKKAKEARKKREALKRNAAN